MNYYDENTKRQMNFPDFLSGFFPGFPDGNPPGAPGGGQSGFPTPGGVQSVSPPDTAPPSFIPAQNQFQAYAVDPGAIQGCLYRFTYVWLYRDSFWFFPVFVGRRSISGFRWTGYRWVYFGVDLDRIQSFQCY